MNTNLLERSIQYAIRNSSKVQRLRKVDQLKIERDSTQVLSTEKSGFMAYLTNEIRTPLNAMIGFADFLTEENIS